MGADQDSVITDSSVFLNDLYHRFLLTPKVKMKCICLQAMAIVYGRHCEDIGPPSPPRPRPLRVWALRRVMRRSGTTGLRPRTGTVP